MADYNTARRDFDDFLTSAGNCMALVQSLPRGSPEWEQANADSAEFADKLRTMNNRWGFFDFDVEILVVQSALEKDPKGNVAKTTDNIFRIMQYDPKYRFIRYNLITNNAEDQRKDRDGNDVVKAWTDADDAESRRYVEKYYGISNPNKHNDALRLLFREREYNPIIDLIEPIKWDGVERCENFLYIWGRTENSDYAREVSRLIFAGGIHRLYNPGCKFDDVPILIGTKQGEGKSSLIRWLAINDQYFGECNQFDGKEAIEQLSGKWIIEIGELLALTRRKEVEASKAYITRTVDSYRRPYDRNTVDLPRRCIFIGTSNNPQPLTDIQNRRWYPIQMKTVGYDLFNHEQECREYILQCWAEMREKYKAHDPGAQNFAKRELVDTYRERQDAARQDDWREGAIKAYLDSKAPGDYVCVRDIYKKALFPNQDKEPSVVDSKDIGLLMTRFSDWDRAGLHNYAEYGRQRSWQKIAQTESLFTELDSTEQIPF